MATYASLKQKYEKRQRDTLIDTITTGLTYADEIAVDLGLIDGISDTATQLDTLFDALPFVMIIATEGSKVILGKKHPKAATKSAGFRAAKSGAAMAIGASVAALAGTIAAVPVAIGVRMLFDQYKSRATLGRRLQNRVDTLRFIRQKRMPDAAEVATGERALTAQE